MSNIAIIGGGASGIMAAVAAVKNPSNTVTIYERGERIGRKILATGNGRCNMTNINASISNYHGSDTEFVKSVINKFWVRDTLKMFGDMGILYKVEDGGKVYPYSDQASAVLDVLRYRLQRDGVIIKCGFEAENVKKHGSGFVITSYKGETAYADKVIIAAGGKAAPNLGSNGSGYGILKALGHHVTELTPSLVQIKTALDTAKKLQGIKLNANVTLGKFSEYGEVLFTEYGLSGPAIFSLSSRLSGQKKIFLDIMPEYSEKKLINILFERKNNNPDMMLEMFLVGMLNKRVGQIILKQALNLPLSKPACEMEYSDIENVARLIKKWEFEISGTMSWNNAQVTKGGVYTSEFDSETMESKKIKGIYASGEVLDIDGDCGGYNLQWAWSTGYIAGMNSGEVIV